MVEKSLTFIYFQYEPCIKGLWLELKVFFLISDLLEHNQNKIMAEIEDSRREYAVIAVSSDVAFIGPVKQKNLSVKLQLFSYPQFYTCVLGALIDTVILSTHNLEISKIILQLRTLIWRPEH